jgi:hypothetical protein
MKKVLLILLLFNITNLFAQDVNSYIEMLRSDVKAQKKEIITEAMQFTDQEAEAFWPIYREYEFKMDKLADKRVANIKDFAANFETMTDEKADELIETAFDYQEERLKLEKDLYNKVKDKLGAAKAAKLIQIEHQMLLLIDLKINSELPLIEKPTSDTKPDINTNK